MTTYSPDGSAVAVVSIPLPGPAVAQRYHRRQSGERLDHIASRFFRRPDRVLATLRRQPRYRGARRLANANLVGIPLNTSAAS